MHIPLPSDPNCNEKSKIEGSALKASTLGKIEESFDF
jgi:hypothetical protein